MNFTNFYFLEKKKSQINYYLLYPICKKCKNFKISYNAFDENGYCLLSESAKKNYSFLCYDRNNFINYVRCCIQQRDNDVFEILIEILNVLKNFGRS